MPVHKPLTDIIGRNVDDSVKLDMTDFRVQSHVIVDTAVDPRTLSGLMVEREAYKMTFKPRFRRVLLIHATA
jgi:hypothetical protein